MWKRMFAVDAVAKLYAVSVGTKKAGTLNFLLISSYAIH